MKDWCNARRFRFSLRGMLGLVAVVSITVAAVHYLSTKVVLNPYTSMQVGQLVTDYLHDNNNEWPHSWDQLEEYYSRHVNDFPLITSFDLVKEKFEIDFDIESQTYIDNRKLIEEFSPVRFRAKLNSHVVGLEANDIIRGYLRNAR